MPKLLLINPSAKTEYAGFGNLKSWGMPPLNLCYVAAVTPKNWEIKIVDEYKERLNLDENADLIGITAYSSSITRAYELASEYRRKRIPTVLGGIHASLLPEEALRHFDTVVVGEAELIWGDVISDFEAGKMKTKYTGARPTLTDLPVPRRDLLTGHYEIDVIQTTRGCPFACDFCSVSMMNGREYRLRPVGEILDELEQINGKLVYFVDDNMFGSTFQHQERAVDLCKGMIERGIKKYWMTQTSINIADNEEALEYAYRAGLRMLFIGIESPRIQVLRERNKGMNLKAGVSGLKKSIATIHKHGIGIVGSFIVGNDHDDLGIFDEYVEFIRDAGVDVTLINLLTPLPRTVLYEKLAQEGRIIYDDYPADWLRYTFDQPVYKPKGMTIDQLIRGFDYVQRETMVSWPAITSAFIKTLFRTRSIETALFAYQFNRDNRPTVIEQQNLHRKYGYKEKKS